MDGFNGEPEAEEVEELVLEEEQEIEETETAEEEDDGEFRVSFGEDEAEEQEEVAETPTIKHLRGLVRELSGKIKQYEKAAPAQKAELIDPGPEPEYEGNEELYDYEPAKAIAAWKAWNVKKQDAEKQNAAIIAEQEKVNQRGKEIFSKYQERAKALPVKDYDVALDAVRDALGDDRLGFIIAGADEPEKLVYALYKNPKRLDALSKVDESVRFAFQASKLEKDMKVATRKAPAPEGIQRGSGKLSTSVDKHLEKLEAEAARTGKRDKVVAYKAELRSKGA